MNVSQLKNIIHNLPNKLIKSLGESDFKTCWYGSAGLDTKILDYFSSRTPNSLLNDGVLDNNPVIVYFFTDNDYDFGNDFIYLNQHCNFRNGISSPFQYEGLIRTGECIGNTLTFCGHYLSKLVEYKINNTLVYCFYISINDSQFEQLIIAHDLKIDIGCHAAGWAGDGPTLFNELGLKFYLGNYPEAIEQVFNVEIINNNVSWGLVGSLGNFSCSFYKIIND